MLCRCAKKKQWPWRMFEDLSVRLPNDRTNQAGCYHLAETNSWEGYRSLVSPQLNPIQYLVGLTLRQPRFPLIGGDESMHGENVLKPKNCSSDMSTQDLDSTAESQVTREWTFPLGGFTPHHTRAQRALFPPHFDIGKRKSQTSACCSALKSLCHFDLSTNRSRPLTSEAQNSPFPECFIVTGNFIIVAAPCSFFFYF